jgi:hypothetical protein
MSAASALRSSWVTSGTTSQRGRQRTGVSCTAELLSTPDASMRLGLQSPSGPKARRATTISRSRQMSWFLSAKRILCCVERADDSLAPRMAPRRTPGTAGHGSDLRAPVGLEPTALGLGIVRAGQPIELTCGSDGVAPGIGCSTGSSCLQFAPRMAPRDALRPRIQPVRRSPTHRRAKTSERGTGSRRPVPAGPSAIRRENPTRGRWRARIRY